MRPGNPCNPSDPRKVFTDFDPTYKAQDYFYALNWKQNITSWLDSTLVLGFDRNSVTSQESYNNVDGLTFDPTRLAVAEGTFLGVLGAFGGASLCGPLCVPYFAVPGQLPVSAPGNLGIAGGHIQKFTPEATAFDQSNGRIAPVLGGDALQHQFRRPELHARLRTIWASPRRRITS